MSSSGEPSSRRQLALAVFYVLAAVGIVAAWLLTDNQINYFFPFIMVVVLLALSFIATMKARVIRRSQGGGRPRTQPHQSP